MQLSPANALVPSLHKGKHTASGTPARGSEPRTLFVPGFAGVSPLVAGLHATSPDALALNVPHTTTAHKAPRRGCNRPGLGKEEVPSMHDPSTRTVRATSQRDLVAASLHATAAHDIGGPLRRIELVQATRCCACWLEPIGETTTSDPKETW